jgi:hypothetical protein
VIASLDHRPNCVGTKWAQDSICQAKSEVINHTISPVNLGLFGYKLGATTMLVVDKKSIYSDNVLFRMLGKI